MQSSTDALRDKLYSLGFIYPVSSGIQIDVNAVQAAGQTEASLCDHNCTAEVGGYDCPAAISKNRGLKASGLATEHAITAWISKAVAGIRSTQEEYAGGGRFANHCRDFKIPTDVATIIAAALESGKIEVNLFGGNPELHPRIVAIIRTLKAWGLRVNLTTTGGRFMRDAQFTQEIFADPPDVLALSADDLKPGELKYLLGLDLNGLKSAWKKIPADHGQERKAVEAIHGARLFQDHHGPPLILFNMVLSRTNIHHAREITDILEEALPRTIVNPYPNQEGFHHGYSFFTNDELRVFESLVDWAITRHVEGGRFVKRLHYWLLMKSVFETWRNEPQRIARAVAGYGIWRCYARTGAGRYVQIGRAPREHKSEQKQPGGRLGCFWNDETVTETVQVETAQQVSDFILGGNTRLSEHSLRQCPGCAMPRLLFDLPTLESGMDAELIPEFLRLRRQHAGF